MTTRRWALLFGIRCLLLFVVAILPSKNLASHHGDDSTVKHLADYSIHADIKSLNDVTSASSVRKRFVTGKIGEKWAIPKIASSSSSSSSSSTTTTTTTTSSSRRRREKTIWKEVRQEVREMKKNILPVLAGNISYMQLDFKNMDRNFYNVIGEVRFVKNELHYIKHQAHVIWENVTDSRRDHKRISNILWRILGNVTLALTNIERTSRTLNEFRGSCIPMGQRLERVLESQVAVSDLAYVRDSVNVQVGRSKIEVLGSVNGITEEVRGLRRTMVHMGQGLPEFQRHLVSGFMKTEEMLNAGYGSLIGNISAVKSVMFGQTGRMATIDRSLTATKASLRDISNKYSQVWNIMIIMFDRVSEIGANIFVSNTNAYQGAIDTKNRLNAIAVQLEIVVSTLNSFKAIIETIKPKLRAIRRAVWKKCECSKNNRTSQNNEDYDDEDEYDDDDILSIYDENVPTAKPTVAGGGGGGSSIGTTSSSWPTWFPSQSPPMPSVPPATATTNLIYPPSSSSSSNYYPSGHPPIIIDPQQSPSPPSFHPTFYPTTTPFYYPEGAFPGPPPWPPAFPSPPPYPTTTTTTTWTTQQQQQQQHQQTTFESWPTWYPPPSSFPGEGTTSGWPFESSTSSKPQESFPLEPPHHYPSPPPPWPPVPTAERPMWYPIPHPSGQGTSAWPSSSSGSTQPTPGAVSTVGLPIGCNNHFTGYCVCVCACDCICPTLRRAVEIAIFGNATNSRSEVPVKPWEKDCRCLCPCICPQGSILEGPPRVPTFEPPPPPPPPPPSFFPTGLPSFGSGSSPAPEPPVPPLAGTAPQCPSYEWHHRELLNEIVRANKLIRDDLENTRKFIKAEHETTRRVNSLNTRHISEYILQHTSKYFEESHKLSRESIEMLRVVQTQMKQALEKTALALKAMAVNIMQFHREIDSIMRQGKQKPSFDPSEIVGAKFHNDYHAGPGQPADYSVYHGNGNSRLRRSNQTVDPSTMGPTLLPPGVRVSARKMFTTLDETPNYKTKHISSQTSARERIKSTRKRRGGGGGGGGGRTTSRRGKVGKTFECPTLDEYTRGSPSELEISSKMQTNSGSMLLADKKIFPPLGNPFSFRNLLQRHIGNQLMNAIQSNSAAYNFGRKARLDRRRKLYRHDLSPQSMFPGFPLIMGPLVAPVAPRPRLPPVGFYGSVAIGTLPSFVSNLFRQVARGDTDGYGAATAPAASSSSSSSPYSISYNDGKGNSWNVNVVANRHSKKLAETRRGREG